MQVELKFLQSIPFEKCFFFVYLSFVCFNQHSHTLLFTERNDENYVFMKCSCFSFAGCCLFLFCYCGFEKINDKKNGFSLKRFWFPLSMSLPLQRKWRSCRCFNAFHVHKSSHAFCVFVVCCYLAVDSCCFYCFVARNAHTLVHTAHARFKMCVASFPLNRALIKWWWRWRWYVIYARRCDKRYIDNEHSHNYFICKKKTMYWFQWLKNTSEKKNWFHMLIHTNTFVFAQWSAAE